MLCYHGIDSPERFEQQVAYLADTMNPVSLADAQAALCEGRALPERAVLLTFDDGERSLLEKGMPIMRARGVPGVSYVIGSALGTDDPFWWNEVTDLVSRGGIARSVAHRPPGDLVQALKGVPDDVRLAVIGELRASASAPAARMPQMRAEELAALEAGGIAVGNHTLTHPCLNRCSDEKIEYELAETGRIIAEALGSPRRTLAYPNGDFDGRVTRIAHDLGFRLAFALGGLTSAIPAPRVHSVNRLYVDSRMSLDRFAIIASGLLPAALRARRTIRGIGPPRRASTVGAAVQ